MGSGRKYCRVEYRIDGVDGGQLLRHQEKSGAPNWFILLTQKRHQATTLSRYAVAGAMHHYRYSSKSVQVVLQESANIQSQSALCYRCIGPGAHYFNPMRSDDEITIER